MNELPTLVISSMERAPWGWVLMVTVLLALIKTWPIIHLQVMNAKATLRGEERSDLGDCRQELQATNKRLDGAIERIHQLELKLFGTVSAYRIVADKLESVEPECSALIQARTIFREIWDIGPVPPDMVAMLNKMQ